MRLTARQLRESGDNWKKVIYTLVGFGLLAVFVIAVGAAQVFSAFSYEEEFNFGIFLLTFIVGALPVFGFALPYIMMTDTLHAVADGVESVDASRSLSRSSGIRPRAPEKRQAIKTPAPPPVPAAPPAKPAYDPEPSRDVRRVAGAVGALGNPGLNTIAKKLDMTLSQVGRAVDELKDRGWVESVGDGTFRYVPPEQRVEDSEMVYCVTCRFPVTRGSVATHHSGHNVREM